MKRTWLAAILVLTLSFHVAARVQSTGEMLLFSTTLNDGPTVEWVVDERRFCASSNWSPEKDAPLLSTTRAVQAAMSSQKAKGRWILTAVSIRAVSCGQHFGWYYYIEMYDDADAFGDVPPDMGGRVVLMDGTVVTPRKRAPK